MTQAALEYFPSSIRLSGTWTAKCLGKLSGQELKQDFTPSKPVTIDGGHVKSMDTSGALFLCRIIEQIKQQGFVVDVEGLNPNDHALLQLVNRHSRPATAPRTRKKGVLEELGKEITRKVNQLKLFLDFAGKVVVDGMGAFSKSKRANIKNCVSVMLDVGNNALPILGLLSFLIGVVLAYQIGLQLKTYGANVFVVQLTGMSIFREFAPLITAIIMAGRTSSAFTSFIGMMKINEEIDAMATMGISPYERLIFIRILAVFLVMPLLVFWSDVFCMIGSMVMSKMSLDISYTDFMTRLRIDLQFKDYFMGLIKAPVFSLIVASVGCFQGLQVAQNAESIGRHTTHSVVQTIFLVIVADAMFSVLFSWAGL